MEEAQIQQTAAAQAWAAARPTDSGEDSDLAGSGDERRASGADDDDNDGQRGPTPTPTLQTWSRNRSVPDRQRARTWDLDRGSDAPRAVVAELPPARDPHTQVRLPKYSGQSELQTFLIQLETAAEYAGWSDRATTAQLILALEGEALTAIDGLTNRHDGAAIINALQDRFGETDVAERSVTLLQDRVRKAGESLAVFAADLRRLVRRGYPDSPREAHERTLRRAFLRGLTPEWLRRAASSLPTTDFSTTLQEAGRLETNLAPLEKPQPRAPAPRTRAAHPEEGYEEEEEEVARQATTPAAPNRYTGRGGPCYRCQETGHVAEDCEALEPRNRPACRRCGRGGHQAGDCRAPRKQDRRPPPPAGNGRGAAQ